MFAALQGIKRPLAREDLVKSAYLGRRVKWTGTVESAGRSYGGGFSVSAMWERTFLFLDFPESEHGVVDALMENDIVEFEGRIREVTGMVGVTLEEVRILSVAKPPAFRPDPDQG